MGTSTAHALVIPTMTHQMVLLTRRQLPGDGLPPNPQPLQVQIADAKDGIQLQLHSAGAND